MLRMCITIFGPGNAVVLDSVFCVDKFIIQIEDKGVYVADPNKKRCYWPKLFPGDLIDTQFEYKEVSDVGMIEARTENNKFKKYF